MYLKPFIMPRAKSATTRPKSTAEYRLTVSLPGGREVYSVGGSLARCLSLMGDSVFCFAAYTELDSYHKIRRELVASGGGYAKYYKAEGGGVVLVDIISCELLPAVAPCTVPMERPPVDNSLPLDVVYQHPEFYSGFANTISTVTPASAAADFVPVECLSCKESFLQNPTFSNELCAACLSGERSSAPRPVELGAAAPATPRPRRAPRPLTDGEFIEAKARQLYERAGLPVPPLPSVKRNRKK